METSFDIYVNFRIPSNPDPEHPIQYLLDAYENMTDRYTAYPRVTTSVEGLTAGEQDIIIQSTPALLLNLSRQSRDLAAFVCSLVGPDASLYQISEPCDHEALDESCMACMLRKLGETSANLEEAIQSDVAFHEEYRRSACLVRHADRSERERILSYERDLIPHRVAAIEAKIYTTVYQALLQSDSMMQIIEKVMAMPGTAKLANLVYNAGIASTIISKESQNLDSEILLGIQL